MEISRIITDSINEFQHLQDLYFTSYTNKGIFELEHFIDNCRLLKDVEFTPICLDGLHNRQAVGRRRDEGEIADLSTVNQLPTVKKFTRDKMMMTDWSIRYLMHKFPQVDRLILNAEPDEDCDTMVLQTFHLNVTTMLEFFQYIARMPHY